MAKERILNYSDEVTEGSNNVRVEKEWVQVSPTPLGWNDLKTRLMWWYFEIFNDARPRTYNRPIDWRLFIWMMFKNRELQKSN